MGAFGGHPSDELLSAFSDRETTPAEHDQVRLHLRSCDGCSDRLETFKASDELIRAGGAGFDCETIAPLLSAELDGELGEDLLPLLRQHLVACSSCTALRAAWADVDAELTGLPLARPSARVDAAIAALSRPRRVALPRAVAFVTVRVAAAVVVAVAVLGGSILLPRGPQEAALAPDTVLVAGAQRVVLNPETNLIYILRPETADVVVREASTDHQVGVVDVGGTPTALALDRTTNSIFVLDSSAKTIVRIDGSTNAIVSSAPLTLAGAPVSLTAENGKLVVATAGGANGGQVALVDASATVLSVKTVETIDVAPSFVLVDPISGKTFVLGNASTLVLDSATLDRVAALPGGGVSAATNGHGLTAILASVGGKARVLFYGASAPGVDLPGAPLAITTGPDRTFAALVDIAGHARVVQLDETGVFRSLDLPFAARQLAYDASAAKFTLLGSSADVVAYLSSSLTLTTASPSPSLAPQPVATPAPSQSPAASVTPSTSPASASPAAVSAPPIAVVTPPVPGARLVWTGTYFIDLPGWRPVRVASRGDGVWFVDRSGVIASFDRSTGVARRIAQLPGSDQADYFALAGRYAYAVDVSSNRLHLVDLASGSVLSIDVPFRGITGVAVTPNGHAWLSSRATGSLVEFDPAAQAFGLIATPIAKGLFGISADTGGRIWYAYPSIFGVTLGMYDPFAHRTIENGIAALSSVDGVFADNNGGVWLSSPTGRWVGVRDGKISASVAGLPAAQRFLVGPSGGAWLMRLGFSETRLGDASGALNVAFPNAVIDATVDGGGNLWAAAADESGLYLANSVTTP